MGTFFSFLAIFRATCDWGQRGMDYLEIGQTNTPTPCSYVRYDDFRSISQLLRSSNLPGISRMYASECAGKQQLIWKVARYFFFLHAAGPIRSEGVARIERLPRKNAS